MSPTFHIRSFGCRASQADGAALEASLLAAQFEPAGSTAPDFVIFNSCTVTAAADDELRREIRRLHRRQPACRIVVTGCYAQRAPSDLAVLPGVVMVAGNSHKTDIARLLTESGAMPFHSQIHVADMQGIAQFRADPVINAGPDRSRPNLKVQDGCGNRCSFCIIPSVRGPSRSARPEQVIEQVRALSRNHAEIVLTGINLGRWGRDRGMDLRFAGLLRLLLAETDVPRLRLSSVEPMDWSDELLELLASTPRLASHVHIPLQSGSDAVLRRMRRRYRSRHYRQRVQRAREVMPDAAIGADVMAGFPGETEAEFAETVALIEELPLTYLHVFPYSERPGTTAVTMNDPVSEAIRSLRARLLIEAGLRKNIAFRWRMAGRTLPAVALASGQEALTTNFVRVELAQQRPPRELLDVTIGEIGASFTRERHLLPILA